MLNTLKFILFHELNRRNKIKTILRFFSWQIISRISSFSFVIPFVNDSFYIAKRGMTGITGNWYCGLHEFHEMAFVLHFYEKMIHL